MMYEDTSIFTKMWKIRLRVLNFPEQIGETVLMIHLLIWIYIIHSLENSEKYGKSVGKWRNSMCRNKITRGTKAPKLE